VIREIIFYSNFQLLVEDDVYEQTIHEKICQFDYPTSLECPGRCLQEQVRHPVLAVTPHPTNKHHRARVEWIVIDSGCLYVEPEVS
jgi:hypothetical protein